MKKFDPTIPVQTRDGRKARIIATDVKGIYSIVALVSTFDGEAECAETYTADGFYYNSDDRVDTDLINTPIKREGWIAIYRAPHLSSDVAIGATHVFNTERRAIQSVSLLDRTPITTIPVTWEE